MVPVVRRPLLCDGLPTPHTVATEGLRISSLDFPDAPEGKQGPLDQNTSLSCSVEEETFGQRLLRGRETTAFNIFGRSTTGLQGWSAQERSMGINVLTPRALHLKAQGREAHPGSTEPPTTYPNGVNSILIVQYVGTRSIAVNSPHRRFRLES